MSNTYHGLFDWRGHRGATFKMKEKLSKGKLIHVYSQSAK